MSLSLRDQLLKAGLVTEKQARQAESDQRRHARHDKTRKTQATEPSPAAKQSQAAKAARDQELNRRQQDKAAAKARAAELRQLIDQHRVPRVDSDDFYNFVVSGKVRRIPVDAALRGRIVRGDLVVVRCDGQFDLVPVAVVERIRERDAGAVVHANDPSARTAGAAGEAAGDDPYRDFVVPDDLVW